MVTQVTNLGRSGLYDWLFQRVSAVVLLAYVVFVAVYLLCNPQLDYAQWSALFGQTWMRAFSSLAVLSVVGHAWIGLWAVSTDYMTTRMMGRKATVVRLLFQAVCVLVLFYYLVWGLQILWG
ncbi:MAG TPA: succinate dehydrogenase, hydrophobic membrane anchor protein [Pseudomonadales bacterium]